MSKQNLISIIKSSQLSDKNKQKLISEINTCGETKDTANHVKKSLLKMRAESQQSLEKLKVENITAGSKKINAEEFKEREFDRLVGEKARQLRQQYLWYFFKIARLMKYNTDLAIKMIEEDQHKSKATN
ncbi:hypothetical protein KJ903_05075 [Patescibacteria group bacterium]|nr:hypothetical protein [Patescibacteria group bacterium]